MARLSYLTPALYLKIFSLRGWPCKRNGILLGLFPSFVCMCEVRVACVPHTIHQVGARRDQRIGRIHTWRLRAAVSVACGCAAIRAPARQHGIRAGSRPADAQAGLAGKMSRRSFSPVRPLRSDKAISVPHHRGLRGGRCLLLGPLVHSIQDYAWKD